MEKSQMTCLEIGIYRTNSQVKSTTQLCSCYRSIMRPRLVVLFPERKIFFSFLVLFSLKSYNVY
ncbi:serine carboxypeptidase II-3 [Iris pallida]|uniref:Serine carboxypeptidase II-3 n=1 Tax=Iris pallida TaxID=29817 RepID=A0AAX6F9X6_IRIPA|nr:serine carboxypeptidase II-3 [Iris pallida]